MPLIDEHLLAAGDQRILLDDGIYTIGRDTKTNPFNVTRPASSGRFGGWLEIKAKNKWGVVLDLDPDVSAGLFLDSVNPARLRLMGIDIINGVMEPRQPDIDLWYCRNTFMGSTWSAQGNYRTITVTTTSGSNVVTRTAGAAFTAADQGKYLQAGSAGLGGSNKVAPVIQQVLDGNRAQLSYAATSSGSGRTANVGTSPAGGYYGNCIPILSTSSNTKRFSMYGSDLFTSGDGVRFQRTDDIWIEGSILDTDGTVPFDPTDRVHDDIIDGEGGSNNRFTVRDTRLLGRLIFSDHVSAGGSGRQVTLDFDRVEHNQRNLTGLIMNARAGPQSSSRGLMGSLTDYKAWNYVGARREHIRNDSTGATIVHDTADEWNDIPSRINVTETNVSRTGATAPSLHYPEDWRVAHPYGSHDAFFGTGEDPPPPPPPLKMRKETTGLAPGTILTRYDNTEMARAASYLSAYGGVYRHDIRLSQVYAAGWRPGLANQSFWWTRYDNEFQWAKDAGCDTVILCINDFGPYGILGSDSYPAQNAGNIAIVEEWVVDALEHVRTFMGPNVRIVVEVMNEPNVTLHINANGDASVAEFAFWYDVIFDALIAHDPDLEVGPGAPAASDTVPLAGETTSNLFSRPSGSRRQYSPADWYRNLFENTGNALGSNALKINGKFRCLFVHPYAHAQGRGVMDRVDNVTRPTAWPAPRTTLPIQMNYGQLRTVKEIWLIAVLNGNDPAYCICHGTETGFDTAPYYNAAKTYVTDNRVFLTKGTIDAANRFVTRTQPYRAKINVPINTPPPNATYWEADNNVIWHEEDLGAQEITWYWDCWYGETTDPDGVNLGFVEYDTVNFGTYEGPITGLLTWFSPEDMVNTNDFQMGLLRPDGSLKGSVPGTAGHIKSLNDQAVKPDNRAEPGVSPPPPVEVDRPTVIGAVGGTAASGSITLTTPVATKAGDAIIVCLATDDETTVISNHNAQGWVTSGPHGNSGANQAALFRRYAAQDGATAYTFTAAGALAAALVVVRGMDPVNFLGMFGYDEGTGSTTTHTASSLTNNRQHSLFLVFFAANNANGGVAYTAPSGMTDLIGTQAKPGVGVTRPTVVVYAQEDIGTGSTGSRTATASPGSRYVAARVLVFDELDEPEPQPTAADWTEIGVTPINLVQG